jgi:3-hydroxyacyl-CoA dehydrogenase/enoyl-CoA hydratase/3-hydroxybutyryl-CoA epimerase
MDPLMRTNIDADNVMTVLFDAPAKSVNTCSPQFFAELGAVLDMIERDKPAAVIFASAKPRSFIAGADLFEISKMTPEQVAHFVALGQTIFERIARLPMPTVAAINGDCLGGGYELALACRYRVAADDTSISIGLPETKIGLLPGWGGTTRLPRTIGLRRALPILLGGKTMPPRKAQKAGLIDEVVRSEAVLHGAKRIVRSGARRRRPGWIDRAIARIKPIRNRILAAAHRSTMQLTYGNYPAPLRLIEVLRDGYEGGTFAGFDAERRAVVELGETDALRNLMRLFFLRQGAKKRATENLNAKPRDVKQAAVIGGGTMGAGIVHALVRAGIAVRLVEVNAQAIGGALGRISKMLADDVGAGRIDKLAAKHAFNRVSPTTEWTGLGLCDLVVEAVAETMDVKREVFVKLDRLTKPTCVLATNTSSLSVAEMARATEHPNRVVGLHFFNPVPKMPLVEVVRTDMSDDVSLATAVAVVGKFGKTPVLVADAPGFLVNRILVPYLAEALHIASEGVPIRAIDEAAKRWGMPMGPFELYDEIGLDIAAHVLQSLAGKKEPPHNVIATFELAVKKKWLGKKSGRGFYAHDAKKRRKKQSEPQINDELVAALTGGRVVAAPDWEAIASRLVQPMIDEANGALDEGVTDAPETVDLAVVMGTGLAPFRGGILQFAEVTRSARVPTAPVPTHPELAPVQAEVVHK